MHKFLLKLLRIIKMIQAQIIYELDKKCTNCLNYDIATLRCRLGVCQEYLDVQYLSKLNSELTRIVNTIRRMLIILNNNKNTKLIGKMLEGLR